MGRPRQVTDEQITEAARACFLEQGPGAPMEAIAGKLGVTAAAVLRRFGSKEALLLRALHPGEPSEALKAAPDPRRPIPAQLEKILVLVLADVRQTVPRIATLRASGLPVRPTGRAEKMRRALTAWLDAAHTEGRVAARDFPAAADALLGAIESRAWQDHIARRQPGRDDKAFIAALVDTLWTGLAPARENTHR